MKHIFVDVKAGSSKDSVERIDDNHYLVHVRAQPRKGKANLAIVKLLRRELGTQVRLVAGHFSNTKVFEVEE